MSTGTTLPLLLGHRGACRYAPENTLAAFELALDHGCDGFEFDVRRTADGRAVVSHDSHLAGVSIAQSTYPQLLQTHPSLVTLENVLVRFASRAYLYIELKVGGVEDEVLRAIAAHVPARGYVVASFLPDVLLSIRRRSASVPLGLICASRRQLLCWRVLPVAVVMIHFRLASRRVIDELHGAGKQVFVWTVNRSRRMKLLKEAGVDGILSDDTALLVRTVRAS
jgi:glycerophosphoryl diester phosphodiesterase